MFELPDWTMPPKMIGGLVAGPLLIEHSERLVVAVRQVLAYPTGVEFDIEAHGRGPAGPREEPLFAVRFADGGEVRQDDDTGLRSGLGPMLVVSRTESSWGAPEGNEDTRLSLWLWPLPPPGPLTLLCSWVHRGLHDASLVLDADAIRSAAHDARPFWPEES